MELYSSNMKKSLYFQKWNPALFSPSSKNKKSPPREKFLILHETEAPKKLLIFSQKKAFLTFRETETLKKLLIFQETETSKKLLIF